MWWWLYVCVGGGGVSGGFKSLKLPKNNKCAEMLMQHGLFE